MNEKLFHEIASLEKKLEFYSSFELEFENKNF